jgi:hypothetical protein
MAQSNYNIPNDSAPAVRAQLNSVFQSIATNNSGTAAPSTTFAHQWWYDSTANILKQRNAADSAWIDIGTFDQTGGTFSPAGVAQLTQGEAENPASTVFGTVSGQRIGQSINANFNVSGSAPKYACRAWASLDGSSSPSVRGSGNISSITLLGTGDYRCNFATAMPDVNYAVACMCVGDRLRPNLGENPVTTSVRIQTSGDSQRFNIGWFTVAVFR